MRRELVLAWHLHQPFFVPDEEVREQVARSYEPLLALHEGRDDAPLSLNVCGGLLVRLAALAPDWVARLREAIAVGRVELLGSGMWHPMLPLLPIERARAQIEADARAKEELLGVRPRGFWPTDLGWAHHLVPLVADAGIEWVTVDSSAKVAAASLPAWDEGRVMGQRVLRPELAPLVGPTELAEVHQLELGDARVRAMLRHHGLSWDFVDQQRGVLRHPERLEAWLEAIDAHYEAGADLLVIGDDGERVDPQTLTSYRDALDALIDRGVVLRRGSDAARARSARPIYLPASTFQVDFAPWMTTPDDLVCRRRLEHVQARLAEVTRRRGADATADQSARLLEVEDSAFTFWRYLRRTREPFLVRLTEIEAALDAL